MSDIDLGHAIWMWILPSMFCLLAGILALIFFIISKITVGKLKHWSGAFAKGMLLPFLTILPYALLVLFEIVEAPGFFREEEIMVLLQFYAWLMSGFVAGVYLAVKYK